MGLSSVVIYLYKFLNIVYYNNFCGHAFKL
jgi:hypothetical protein